MKYLHTFVVIGLSSLMFLGIRVSSSDATENRTVQLAITVKRVNGEPIPDAPLCARSKGAQSGAATNQQGAAVIDLTVAPDEDRIAVQIASGCHPFRGSIRRFREIIESAAVQSVYWADIPSGATSATLAITVDDPVFITGRLVDAAGSPQQGIGQVRNAIALSSIGADGRLRLPVRKGVNSELYFIRDGKPVKVVPVAARNEDLDLGDVQAPSPGGNASVRISLTDAGQVDHRLEDKCLGIALVSADGNTVLNFLTKEGLAVAKYGTGELPSVPAGTFYVSPGKFGNSLSFRVLDAVRNGVNLEAAGVPKIVAVAGQETALTVNVPQAEAAINSLGTPPQSP